MFGLTVGHLFRIIEVVTQFDWSSAPPPRSNQEPVDTLPPLEGLGPARFRSGYTRPSPPHTPWSATDKRLTEEAMRAIQVRDRPLAETRTGQARLPTTSAFRATWLSVGGRDVKRQGTKTIRKMEMSPSLTPFGRCLAAQWRASLLSEDQCTIVPIQEPL